MIKFLVMDVDGTLTDGKVYMGNDGEVFKAFDIKDGCGILVQLPKHGIIPVIVTARNSQILFNRCKEIGITEIHQGVRAKLDCLNDILAKYSTQEHIYTLTDVAYIGDDLLDLLCLEPVKAAGGLAACPSNAIPEVLSCCDYVAPHKGGEGAVRDLVEYIINVYNKPNDLVSLNDRINKAIEYISKLEFDKLCVGCYVVNEDFYYSVQEYEAFEDGKSLFESHRKYVDIQWIIEGNERLYINDICHLEPAEDYNEERDVIHYKENECPTSVLLTRGSCVVLLPKDAHKPGVAFEKQCVVKKIVGKLLIK